METAPLTGGLPSGTETDHIMPTPTLDDDRTLEAIGILADVLDDQTERGGLDTVLVSKALRQVIATRSQPAFDFASRAFNNLEPGVRRRVADGADEAARRSVDLRRRAVGFLATAPQRPRQPRGEPALITALNLRSRRRGGDDL